MMMAHMPDFATKLNHAMMTKGLSQADLRDAIGRTVSHGTISNWCAGRSLPRLDEAHRIATVLGLPLEFLANDQMEEPAAQTSVDLGERELEILRISKLLGPDRALGRLLGIPIAGDFGPLK